MPSSSTRDPSPSDLEGAEVDGLSGKLAWTRDQPLTKAFGQVAKLGDQEPLYAAAAVLALIGAVRRDQRMVVAGARVGAAVAFSDAMKSLTKKLVKRSRPRSVAAGDGYRRELGGSDEKGEQSFPSGHVAATLAASRALGRAYPATRLPGTCIAAALGATRIAQGEHWPSDIAAGAVIGLAAETGSGALIALILHVLRDRGVWR